MDADSSEQREICLLTLWGGECNTACRVFAPVRSSRPSCLSSQRFSNASLTEFRSPCQRASLPSWRIIRVSHLTFALTRRQGSDLADLSFAASTASPPKSHFGKRFATMLRTESAVKPGFWFAVIPLK